MNKPKPKLKIIMNPPYDKNTHLKITDKMTKDFPDAEIVSLQPIGWLQDPLAKDKKSNFNKYSKLRSKIEDIKEIKQETAASCFQALVHQDLGIYKIKDGGFDTEIFIKKYESFVSKIRQHPVHWSDKIEHNKINGVRVKCQGIKFAAPSSNSQIKEWKSMPLYKKYELMYDINVFVDGKHNGKWWTECSKAKNKYTKNIGDPLVDSIKFDTIDEARNFENFAKTKFMTFCNRVSKVGVHTDFSFLPFMPTYKHAWSDEMLYEYFNLTTDEINIIETEMSK